MKKEITEGLERIVGRASSNSIAQSPGIAALLTGVGKLQATLNEHRLGPDAPLAKAEFKVFSQYGDDGIIQHLIHHINLPRRHQVFVEFGVEDYQESNTRFLLVNDNWRGLIIDGSEVNMNSVQNSDLHWKYDLTAIAMFINRDNINDIIKNAGISGPIGILSVDIDGNDYWVWESIDVVDPTIVIAEFNSVFGDERTITIPYDPSFVRQQANDPHLYYGASLAALCHLAQSKGYAFIGCNTAGNNCYFVKRDRLGKIKELSVKEGYVESRFSECVRSGSSIRIRREERLESIRGLPVVDVLTGETVEL
ncbi:MAG TPA: hypothetical protein DDX19_22655 [Rhodopirellula baltica]|uniref:Uncharacterized protein n=1 Tax=Rhodopirellula baltica (strain DSM 10527 / NCIMB 13988 / SH1) TaxID=243090 RepID=Q7UVP9_RHOBA|nr:hypothetical protein [Rhodopirellula baltica]CAD72673.1 hypothetical protein RB2501 [Rhodopirellula baltica SH 1]HBE65501.1 hypothetical protein [Rhodopirellula baltica]